MKHIDLKKRRVHSHRSATKLPDSVKRSHCVSVRLNEAELADLDAQRQPINMQRGEYLRAAALHKLPPTIPEINLEAHRDLGRALGNLSTIATAMRGGDFKLHKEVLDTVKQLRNALIGVKL